MSRIYLSAGEPSGDAHAASLARALRQANPAVDLEGTGGPLMAGAGVRIRHSIDHLSASGLFESAATIPAHLRVLRDLEQQLRSRQYDLVVAVDYPGFHLRVAHNAARAGVPVLFYIAPQLWAWGAGRASRLAERTRRVAVVLPFEEPFLRERGVDARFVGHPLLDAPPAPTRDRARAALGIAANAPVLALLPGSRSHEVRRLWPRFRDAAQLVREAVPGLQVVTATVPGCAYPGANEFRLHRGDGRLVMAAADAGLCKSGTATLEAALAGLPIVIAYRMHAWTHAIARRVVRVRRIGLVNLVAEHDVSPELIQGAASARNLAEAVLPLLDRDGVAARTQREAFGAVRERLGTPGASRRVAEMALELVA